jgi:hypothetical protein
MPMRPLPSFVPWAALALSASFAGCEPMESRGDIFAPAPVAAPAAAPEDPAFAFPTEPPLVLSSEQLAKGDATVGLATAAGVDPGTLPEPADPTPATAAPEAAPAPAPAPPPVGVPAATQWPVRLVSTLPQAQPPRAILGLPSGEERVVSPGSILAEQGLVVMSVTADHVQLAQVRGAGDHATIDTLEIAAQYPTPH